MVYSSIIPILLGWILWSKTCLAAPESWQVHFQKAVTPRMEAITHMHHFLMIVITLIALFVVLLLFYVTYRFRAKKNPTPSKTTHNTLLEVIWTTIPAIIVLAIAIPSVRLIYDFDRSVDADMTVKVTGRQWYWTYEYEGQNVAIDSRLIPQNELKPGQLRNLDVDNRLVLPVGKTVKFHITSADVIHGFAVTPFGIQKNAVPGRINETWVRVDHEGVYYGQCFSICGANHAFMPIAIEVVSAEKYAEFLKKNKTAT